MIVLYTTGCPVCKMLKDRLDQAGVSYEIEEDANKMIELGFKSAPMLRVDDKFLNAGEAIKWLNGGAKL